MSKKLSKSQRDKYKQRNGIVMSPHKSKKCSNCFYMNHSGNLCSKHFIKVSGGELCSFYNPKSHKMFQGGGVSPK